MPGVDCSATFGARRLQRIRVLNAATTNAKPARNSITLTTPGMIGIHETTEWITVSRTSKLRAAPAVDGQDLPRHVVRVHRKEAHRQRDIAGIAGALQHGVRDDALARDFVEVRVPLGPHDRPRCDAVD